MLRRQAWLAMLAAAALAPLGAQAQSYRCVGTDGKKYYGQSIPPQCIGVVVEQMNSQGSVVKRIEPHRADDRAKAEAEAAERRKQAAIAREQTRRDQALLATYGSEKDVEDMRRRALENDQRLLADLEGRIAELRKSPDPKATEGELRVQESLLAEKKKEIAAINAKYDDDKKRYLELLNRGK